MISVECWKQSLGIFTMRTHSMQCLQIFLAVHSYFKNLPLPQIRRTSKIWKWLVSGYMGLHIIKVALRQPASFGRWSVGLMCHKKTFPGLLHQSHHCALLTQGRKDVWIYDVPDSDHTICLLQAGFCRPCSVYPILAIQIWWSSVNCSLFFLFSAGTKLLWIGLGKELGRAPHNTTDNRFILTTACILLIFS